MIVTSLIYQDGQVMSHSLEKYLRNFRYLESLNIPITLFLDKSISGVEFAPHVTVLRTALEDLHFWSLWKNAGVLPRILKEPFKDRLAYMAIMCEKTLFMERAWVPEIDRYTWVDFGIGYLFKTPETSMRSLYRLPELPKGVVAPAIWGKSDYLDRISWRFCGSMISADFESLRTWNRYLRRETELCFPQASWEVNYWARIEQKYGIMVHTYQADHNDSLMRFSEVKW